MSYKLNTLTERQAEILRSSLEMYTRQVEDDMRYMRLNHQGINTSLAGQYYEEELEDINYLLMQLRKR